MNRLDTYERYVTAWSPLSDAERARVLSETVSDDVQYRDANGPRSGPVQLAAFLSGFQDRHPGASFRTVSLLNWGGDGLARWQFIDADGKPGFEGYDAITWAADGRMATIVGFSDSDKQRLK